MKTKTQKKEELKKIKSKFPDYNMVVFTTFARAGEKGLSVSQMFKLKKMLRELNAEFFVVKKTLLDLALKNLHYDGLNVFSLDGSVGLAFGSKNNNIDNKNSIDENNYLLAKKLYEFSKENSALRFFGAFIGGNFVDTETFLEMAKMPSRETLIARLVGMIQYPLRSLAVALSEVAKKQAT